MNKDGIKNVKRKHIDYWVQCKLSDRDSRSYVYKALALLYLNEDIDRANEILNDPKIKDCNSWVISDSVPFILYWAMPALIRTYILFNSSNGKRANNLYVQTGENLKKVFDIFVKDHMDRVFTDEHRPYRVPNSENHDMLQRACILLIAQILKEDETYKDNILPDGRTYQELYAHACEFMELYFKTRARIGRFIEGSDNYRIVTLESIYELMDLCDNENVSRLAKMTVDLDWIEYVTENVNSVRGCAKARVYNRKVDSESGYLWYARTGNMYFGYHDNHDEYVLISFAVSDYLPPQIAYDIQKNRRNLEFESITRIPGVGSTACTQFQAFVCPVYHLSETKSVTKYTYVSDEFVMGSFRQDERDGLVWLSSQNRWEGAVFDGNTEARLFVRYETTESTYQPLHTIQHGSKLITQNITDLPIGLYISFFDFNREINLEDGWLFGEIEKCYYAVKQVGGEIYTKDNRLLFRDNNLPVIVHIEPKRKYADYDEFKSHIFSNLVIKVGDFVFYQDVRCREDGIGLNYDAMQDDYRMIDGEMVKYNQEKMFDNPFIDSDFGSGIISVKVCGGTVLYDFNTISIT